MFSMNVQTWSTHKKLYQFELSLGLGYHDQTRVARARANYSALIYIMCSILPGGFGLNQSKSAFDLFVVSVCAVVGFMLAVS